MERFTDRPWELRGWLLAAASLPAVLALLAILLLGAGARERTRHDLQERATLVAGALAEASEYSLVSGNAAALDRSVRELLAHDKSIAAIDILDASRRPFVSLPGTPLAAGLPSVELPVRSSVPDINFFSRSTPHVSLSEDLQPTFRLGPVAGYVRVTMTTDALERAQRQRLLLELGVVAAAGFAGLLVVAALARRVRASHLALLDGLQAMRQGRFAIAEGPAVGSELRRLQQALVELGETLGAAPPARDGAPWHGPGDGHAQEHWPVGRLILGRLEAALIALRLAAMQAARQVGNARMTPDPQPAAGLTVARIVAVADQAQAAGEALFEPLRTEAVQAIGLEAALAELLQICARALPSCAFSLHLEPGFACADATLAAEVHRAVQGALALVVGRAQASRASVQLQRLPSSSEVRLITSDNGPGEAPPGAVARLRESLAARGARIDQQQAPGGGMTLVVTWPPAAIGT